MRRLLPLLCLFLTGALAGPVMAQDAAEDASMDTGKRIRALEERIRQLEKITESAVRGGSRYDRIVISGLIEVEASYENTDSGDSAAEDEKNSDVDLATVELSADAGIAEHVDGHLLFKYEEDDLFVDEGFITLTGTEAFPAYLIAGRQYIPFGNFDTHFVTDPNTLVLGETNEGAAVAGYRFAGGMIEASAGVFNGKVGETGDDDTIDSFVAGITAAPAETVLLGISYTSNLASSDAMSDITNDDIDSLVAGWSAFVTFGFLDRFKMIAEYVGALDEFAPGEIYDASETGQRQPAAWNVELSAAVAENIEVAARYGGSDDGGAQFLPETQYGAVVNWGLFANTNLALEYLHDEFEDNTKETDTLTAQLAVSF